MASESHLPIVEPEESLSSVIPQLESATAEENMRLRCRMLEMWDAWSNGREPPSTIPGLPELIPRTGGTTNVPISVANPFMPSGFPTMSTNFTGMPYEVRPQAPSSVIPSTVFTAPPASKQERVLRNPEQEEIVRKIKSIEQSLKNIQGLSDQKSMSYADLCMFPHVHLPVGFNMPKFERYDGHGDPIAYLKQYCNQLRGAGGKAELLMAYFGESLIEIASEWYIDQDISHWHIWDDLARDFVRQFQYNVDIAPNINSLSNLKKKASESFREYAIKWREQAARIKPPMDETEMVSVFLQAQEADYFQNMMSAMGKPFAEAIKIGQIVENGLKIGRILSQSALRATSQAIQSGSGSLASRKKTKEGAMMVSSLRNSRRPRDYSGPPSRAPQHYYPHQDAAYAMAPHPYAVMNSQPFTRPQQHYNQNRAPPPRNNPPHQAPYNPRPP
uniref:Retrotransposon gag domain-containing protein n=1 Tax=Nicotiana tabacum TaxID=4097 RepID=A0A1S3XT24_TOBAC|nr:PREDICTED: uncharacterized protein LOC107768415 [Nicotiana tabacum]